VSRIQYSGFRIQDSGFRSLAATATAVAMPLQELQAGSLDPATRAGLKPALLKNAVAES
jgi:hypothetical protein